MKTCARCKADKTAAEFYLKKNGRLHSYCRKCVSDYQRSPDQKTVRRAAALAHHVRNREARLAYKRARMATIAGRSWEMLDGAQRRSAKMGKTCDLTRDWIEKKIQEGRCPLTGWHFDLGGPSNGARLNPHAPSLDRIDSRQGYTVSNTRVVCAQANLAKNDFTDDELIELAKAIVRTISSQASKEEGSTTIPQGSRAKRPEAHSALH